MQRTSKYLLSAYAVPDPGAQGLGRSPTVCSRCLGHRGGAQPAAAGPPENPLQGRFSAPPQGPRRSGRGLPCIQGLLRTRGGSGTTGLQSGRETWKPSTAAGHKTEPEVADNRNPQREVAMSSQRALLSEEARIGALLEERLLRGKEGMSGSGARAESYSDLRPQSFTT